MSGVLKNQEKYQRGLDDVTTLEDADSFRVCVPSVGWRSTR